ncbi:transmembrane protein, putative (macronuclear) [Tetrahymena thermophila SB210]|uniref:Transmembrane protein, putative n=1 Tax=Tetrahymena thermophila (strain SB210) TaxID=312017 RepID=Q23Q50_TETTS|nr:transmembrane protein, putative [Tetrahymena thermophila SB210]EAR98734.3 transmembrane protein, putative [Tetrahymena thermophila SB210]|eukprot:XP_001018979.3 transmembrane protein, putative [Tetrahymena thermophila SB210]
MSFSRIDLFSSSFNFNIGGSNIQRGTIAGAIFTIIVIALTLSYFIYLIDLYFSNKIEPLYRAQNIINNQTQQLDINSNIYAIKINYLFPTDEQLKYTYSVIMGTYKNDTNAYQVNIITKNCEDPNLGEQFECLDQIQFSDDNQKNDIKNFDYNYKFTQINESQQKNCASQQEIDKTVNVVSSDQLKASNIKQQKQKTTIKDGLFIQQESSFTMPFNYNIDNQNLNRQFIRENLGFDAYSIVNLQIDQIYSQISIQYPTIPSVLALVNSVFNLLVILGFFLKIISQSSLKEDFFVILIKNVYQDIYQQILQLNDLKKSNSTIGQQTNSFISNQTQNTQENKLENQKGKEKDKHQNSSKIDDQKQAQDQVIKQLENNIFDQEKCKPFPLQDQQICISIVQKNESEMKSSQENTKLKIENIGPKLSYTNQLKQKDDNQSLIFSKDCFEERNKSQVRIIQKNQIQPKSKDLKSQGLDKQNIRNLDRQKSLGTIISYYKFR